MVFRICFFLLSSIICSNDNSAQLKEYIFQKNNSFKPAEIKCEHLRQKYLLRDFLGMTADAKVAAWTYKCTNYKDKVTTIQVNEKLTQQEVYLHVVGASNKALYYTTDLRRQQCTILAENFEYSFDLDPAFIALAIRSSGSRDYFWILTRNAIEHHMVDFTLENHTKIEEYELSAEISRRTTPALTRFGVWGYAFKMEFMLGCPIIYDPINKIASTIPLPNEFNNSYSNLVLSPNCQYVVALAHGSRDDKRLEVFKANDYSKPIFRISKKHDLFRSPTFLQDQDDLFIVGFWGHGRSGACLYSIKQQHKLVRIYTDDAIEKIYHPDADTIHLKTSHLFGLYTINIPHLLAAYYALNPVGHKQTLRIGERKTKEARKEFDNRIRLDDGWF